MTDEPRSERDLYLRIAASREIESDPAPDAPPRSYSHDYPDDWPDAPAPDLEYCGTMRKRVFAAFMAIELAATALFFLIYRSVNG